MHFTFDIAITIPWSPDTLTEVVANLHSFISEQNAKRLRRVAPGLLRGSDGALWLVGRNGTVGYWRDGRFHPYSLAAADIARRALVAPLGDGGLLVLGRDDRDANVLARLGPTGRLRWRRTGRVSTDVTDLLALEGTFDGIESDASGNAYLIATKMAGVLSRIELASGVTPVSLDLGEFGHTVRCQWGNVFRVVQREGRRYWLARSLADGVEQAVLVAESLQETIACNPEPLPDRGALVRLGHSLLWMSPTGAHAATLPLAGVVRDGNALAVAIRSGNKLQVTRWSAGEGNKPVDLGPVSDSARLVHASSDWYAVLDDATRQDAEHLIWFDSAGRRMPESPVLGDCGAPDTLGALDLHFPTIEPDGSVLLVGTDRAGAYVVRIGSPRASLTRCS